MKKLFALTFCWIFAGAGAVFAQGYGPGGVLNRHNFEAAPEISYRIYHEPGVSREEGLMYGAVFSYAYHNRIMAKGELIVNGGWVDYSNSGKIEDIPDVMLEFRGTGGVDFFLGGKIMVTPYIGLGYRYLNDDGSGRISTTRAAGYERESNYLYSPVGVAILGYLGNRWSLSGNAEFDVFWRGKQISRLSDIPGYSDLENRQKHGYGLRGNATFAKKISSRTSIEFGPFIRYWHVSQSETETVFFNGVPRGTGYEPKNTSTEFGLTFGVRF